MQNLDDISEAIYMQSTENLLILKMFIEGCITERSARYAAKTYERLEVLQKEKEDHDNQVRQGKIN